VICGFIFSAKKNCAIIHEGSGYPRNEASVGMPVLMYAHCTVKHIIGVVAHYNCIEPVVVVNVNQLA